MLFTSQALPEALYLALQVFFFKLTSKNVIILSFSLVFCGLTVLDFRMGKGDRCY